MPIQSSLLDKLAGRFIEIIYNHVPLTLMSSIVSLYVFFRFILLHLCLSFLYFTSYFGSFLSPLLMNCSGSV